jgi:predicted phosphohydrolase
MDILVKEEIKRCYSGHIHSVSEYHLKKNYSGVNFAVVSADYVDFTPVRI